MNTMFTTKALTEDWMNGLLKKGNIPIYMMLLVINHFKFLELICLILIIEVHRIYQPMILLMIKLEAEKLPEIRNESMMKSIMYKR